MLGLISVFFPLPGHMHKGKKGNPNPFSLIPFLP